MHKERDDKKNGAGGVGMYIKKGIDYHIINDYYFLNIELIPIQLTFNKTPIEFVTYYNPPDKILNTDIFKILDEKSLFFVVRDVLIVLSVQSL